VGKLTTRQLSQLVRAGLVQHGADGGYRIHELLRQFGAEQQIEPYAVAATHTQTGQGDRQGGLHSIERTLAHYNTINNHRGATECTYLSGNYTIGDGDYSRASAQYRAGQILYEQMRNERMPAQRGGSGSEFGPPLDHRIERMRGFSSSKHVQRVAFGKRSAGPDPTHTVAAFIE
jgi:hypothetical protein